MSDKLQTVRGTKDLYGENYLIYKMVVDLAEEVSSCYGFKGLATPIFEFADVFKKTLGQESDIVGKEMYAFTDRGGDNITLRPEFTASIARSFISGDLGNRLPLKLFSSGPLFRYERPQEGRTRQFHQINCEIIGAAEVKADIELISMGMSILEKLGISDKITLELNSLGDASSRVKYREILVEYLSDYKDELSEDSQVRLEKNPMRILDSKDEGDRKILVNAPSIKDSYNDESKEFFAQLLEGLDALNIEYKLNSHLVRGLDYYCHTAFEFTTDALGAQNAVGGGGRYDSLIKNMGGADTPAVGFAMGIERIMALISRSEQGKIPEEKRPVAIIPIGDEAQNKAAILANDLRKEDVYIELGFNGNVKKRMKKANAANAAKAIIFGEDEIAQNIVKIRDFDSGEEQEVAFDDVVGVFKS